MTDGFDQLVKTVRAMRADLVEKLAEVDRVLATLTAEDYDGAAEDGFFHGLSMGKSARKVLQITGRPMRSGEIAVEMASRGFVFSSDRPAQSVHDGLRSQARQDGSVVRHKGLWSLNPLGVKVMTTIAASETSPR